MKPDGIFLIPWANGKALSWDVTCAHPLAPSWLATSQRGESAVATIVESKKRTKYKDLSATLHFEPVSVESLGGLGETTGHFLQKLGNKIAEATGDKHATVFLRQRLAIAIQVGNSVCQTETLLSP